MGEVCQQARQAVSRHQDAQKDARLRQCRGILPGVKLNETFERDWEPLEADPTLTPVKLIIILDLYFQLTPITMVAETPEIIDLAKLIHTTPEKIADVMSIYMFCDPYLNREDVLISPLLNDCSAIWQRYGNGNPDKLYQLATELKIYFKKQ